MIEKTWWIGTVMTRNPFDPDMPDSTFRSYYIRWGEDDQDTNQLSPWDMEVIPEDFGDALLLFPFVRKISQLNSYKMFDSSYS